MQGSSGFIATMSAVSSVLPTVMGDGDICIAQMSEGEEMGMLVARVVRECANRQNITISDACIGEVKSIVARRCDDWEKYYAAAAVGLLAAQNLRPNASVTLWGPDDDPGATYPGFTVIQLTPRLSGAVQGAFSMNEKQSFYRLTTQKVDIDVGWAFAGGTVQFSNQIVSSMRFDTSFGDFDERGDALASPLAVFQFRSPRNTVTFNASAIHYDVDEQPLICGATLEYYDTSCRNETDLFLDSLYDMNYAGAIAWMVERRRQQCIKYVVSNRGNQNPGPLPPPGMPPFTGPR